MSIDPGRLGAELAAIRDSIAQIEAALDRADSALAEPDPEPEPEPAPEPEPEPAPAAEPEPAAEEPADGAA